MLVIKLSEDENGEDRWAVYSNSKSIGMLKLFERSKGIQFKPFIYRHSFEDLNSLYKELTKLAFSTGFTQEVTHGYSLIGKDVIRNEDNIRIGTTTGSMFAFNKMVDSFLKSDLKAVINFITGAK